MRIILFITTVLGIGYLPLGGLLAMILGVLWTYTFKQKTIYWKWIVLTQIILGVVLISLFPFEGQTDPSIIVLDEFIAAGIVLLALHNKKDIVLGLITFAILDATKPIARYVETLPLGMGIAGDDLVSATIATLLMMTLTHITKLKSTRQK